MAVGFIVRLRVLLFYIAGKAWPRGRRPPVITALLTAGCFAWFGAPIFWVALPLSSHLTTKRIGNDICDFVRSCKE